MVPPSSESRSPSVRKPLLRMPRLKYPLEPLSLLLVKTLVRVAVEVATWAGVLARKERRSPVEVPAVALIR